MIPAKNLAIALTFCMLTQPGMQTPRHLRWVASGPGYPLRGEADRLCGALATYIEEQFGCCACSDTWWAVGRPGGHAREAPGRLPLHRLARVRPARSPHRARPSGLGLVRATVIADNCPEWVAVCAAGRQRAPGESPECRVPVRDRL